MITWIIRIKVLITRTFENNDNNNSYAGKTPLRMIKIIITKSSWKQ